MPKKPNTSTKYKLAVGVSGTGTTFEAIVKAVQKGALNLEIPFLFCDREALALQKATEMGIKVLKRKKDEHIHDFHSRVIERLKKEGIDFVALAGYLRHFPITESDPFLVLNSHPAAIPFFGGKGMYGIRVHKTVWEFTKEANFRFPYTYSTIHVASPIYDDGAILGLKKLKISESDNPEKIAAKLLLLEHQNYVEVLRRLTLNSIVYESYPAEIILKEEQKILRKIKNRIANN